MTASKTPNLGLMNPVGTDSFAVADFSDTMAILDQNPGRRVVPNQASRPTGWGVNQHGRSVLQADQQIEWVWYQPASNVPGVWKRTFARGQLAYSTNWGQISTSNTDYGNGPVLVQINNVIVPGGRPYRINFRAEWISSTAGMSVVSVFENNSQLGYVHFDGWGFDGGRGMPGARSHSYGRPAPASQTTISFKMTLAAHSSFKGTSSVWAPSLEIEEY